MQLYRFSPIETTATLNEVITYLVEQEAQLATKIIGDPLPLGLLTIFAHYPEEYSRLVGILRSLGEVGEANNGLKVTLRRPIRVHGQTITQLRIRKPDPYRMQVGCVDFRVGDYAAFKTQHLNANPNLRLIERPQYEMIEFFHPDFDVLAYVVSS